MLTRYAVSLQNILRLNGEEISNTDRHLGKQLFPKAGRQKPLEFASDPLVKMKDTMVKPARSGVCSAPSLLVGEIFAAASDIDRKAAVLEDAWRGVLASAVRVSSSIVHHRMGSHAQHADRLRRLLYDLLQETLQDIERRDSFMSGCLEGL